MKCKVMNTTRSHSDRDLSQRRKGRGNDVSVVNQNQDINKKIIFEI